ncbi:MAG: uracil-xanthine permease [Victivallales bacterium]|nr:uracil-xanthine permease [Victivallales bacterium]
MFTTKDYALSLQHLLAMFGATVLVPIITGLNPSTALLCAGLGTLVFHLCTKGIVPVFLGSSFAFIPVLCSIIQKQPENIPYAQCGIIAAGAVYLILSLIVKLVGTKTIKYLFPPCVTGPVIIIIGLSLTPIAIKDAFGFDNDVYTFTSQAVINGLVALFTFVVMAIGMNLEKGIFKLIPILIAIVLGYLLCVILSFPGGFKMDYTPIINAPWVNTPFLTNGFVTLPKFNWHAIVLIAPVALVTFMEHIGDITTNGAVVGKDFFKDPGLHRTLMGDGLATMVAGLLGGPANTTYSENTGVLATTRNYNPALLRLAALFAIMLGLLGKFGAFLQTIPRPVKGGIELMLFGMIAAIGIRTIVESKIDVSGSRNLSIMAGTLCAGLGLGAIDGIPINFGSVSLKISALFIATLVGVLLNLLLPGNPVHNEKAAETPKLDLVTKNKN